MPEPLAVIAVLKQIKDNLPAIKAGWAKVSEANEREAGQVPERAINQRLHADRRVVFVEELRTRQLVF